MSASRWVCVLAGGEGSRLASLTRELYNDDRPKQFCALHGPHTMIEQTLARASMIVPPRRVMVSLCAQYEDWHGCLRSHPGHHQSLQPCNRGTGPAVLLSCLQIAQADPQAVVALMPSDHFVSDDLRWMAAIREAMMWVERHPQAFVMLGVPSEGPETGYGWLLPKSDAAEAPPWPTQFVEKPEAALAAQLHRQGALWNTMVTIFRCDTMLQAISFLMPQWWEELRGALGRDQEALAQTYRRLEAFDFSRDVIQACKYRAHVLPIKSVGWSDLGDRSRLMEALERWPPLPLMGRQPLY